MTTGRGWDLAGRCGGPEPRGTGRVRQQGIPGLHDGIHGDGSGGQCGVPGDGRLHRFAALMGKRIGPEMEPFGLI